MKNFKYCVKYGRDIINEGITTDIKIAKNAFKGYGKNVYGSIQEIFEDGQSCEVAHKKIGGKLYSWL